MMPVLESARRAAYNYLCGMPGVPACFDPTDEAIDALAEDLAEIHDELAFANKPRLWKDVMAELTRRIGGIQNLGSYMSAMMLSRRKT